MKNSAHGIINIRHGEKLNHCWKLRPLRRFRQAPLARARETSTLYHRRNSSYLNDVAKRAPRKSPIYTVNKPSSRYRP